MTCPRCGFENPPRFKFCGECGAPLAARPQPERRQLTVMFCDLVDSTKFASLLDPEELRNLIREYQSVCAQSIARYEGHIAQYLGDGVLVYFGFPFAHEDDAQRAVRSGLEIIAGITRLNESRQARDSMRFAVRIGIHTGLVVVGEVGGGERRELLALGETPNLAARLQALAEPDTIIISAATHHLVHGYFECQSRGDKKMKGIAQAIGVYQVLKETGAQTRLDVAARGGLTPLIGKDHELERMLSCWQSVKAGKGQVVLLNGDAGLGKSRLAQAFKESIAADPHLLLECRCSPYHQNSALYPLIDLLQRKLEFRREESHADKLHKLEQFLQDFATKLEEVLPLFAALLSLPLSERYQPLGLPPDREKQKSLVTLCDLLLKMASQQPVLVVVEDLHWADPSSLEFLGLLLDACTHTHLLLLLTARPSFQAPWKNQTHFTQLNLNRLTPRQVETMLMELTHGKTIPSEVRAQLVGKTDGVPLFVEELTKMVLEAGFLKEGKKSYELVGQLPPLAIPATLQDSLMARLDRLAAVKEVAQVAATLGREFSLELLRAVWPHDQETLQKELKRLSEAELIYQRENSSREIYYFKHALIQEAAYESLLKSKRQQYHQRIAQVLTEKFLETVASQPEIIAYHYTEAGNHATAVAFWLWAGERSLAHSAHAEAVHHLTKGLELITGLPDTLQFRQQELDLLNSLGVALIATKGYAAPEVFRTFTRAWELCQQLGCAGAANGMLVLLGLWETTLLRGDLQNAHALAEQCRQLALRNPERAHQLVGHVTLGVTQFYLGEFRAALENLQRGFHLYNRREFEGEAFLYGQDPGVVCLSYLAHLLYILGYPAQARAKDHEAMTLAEELAHPFSLAFALNFSADLHEHFGESQQTLARIEKLIALAQAQGFTFWVTSGKISKGRTLLKLGRKMEGQLLIQEAIEEFHLSGAILGKPAGYAMLAEIHLELEQVAEGLRLLEEALHCMNASGERIMESLLFRVKGELLLACGAEKFSEAEAWLTRALTVAQQQSAKSLELRSVMSLCQLWEQQGRRAQAYQALAEIYAWFKEGFDTQDLREAKAQLEELSRP